jgi:AcrR family transcriptional regulator
VRTGPDTAIDVGLFSGIVDWSHDLVKRPDRLNNQNWQDENMAEARAIRRKNDDGRREDLIAAATKVIVRDGVAAATTRRIAAEAGVPLGTVHYWFASKDDLLAAVVQSVLDDLESAVAAAQTPAVRPDDSGAPDLLESFRAAWRVVEADEPGRQLSLYELTNVALRTAGMEELAAKQYGSYRAVAAHAVQRWYDHFGAELPGGLEALARLVAYVFDGVTLAWLADPDGAEQDSVFVLLSHLLDFSATGSKP